MTLSLNLVDRYAGTSTVETVTTDARGNSLNRPLDYARKPPGTLRVVAIGASTTAPSILGDNKSWPVLLADRLQQRLGRPVELINAAVPGTRLVHNAAVFAETERYAPDIAVFLIGVNDWNRQIRLAHRPAVLRALEPFAAFSVSDSVLFTAVHDLWDKVLRDRLPRASHRSTDIVINDEAGRADGMPGKTPASVSIDAVSADYARWFRRIADDCNRRPILCLFVDQPTVYAADIDAGLLPYLWMTPPAESYTLGVEGMAKVAALYNGWLKAQAQGPHLAFCPAAARFPPTRRYFYDDVHYTEAGAKLMAGTVFDCLMQEAGRFPPQPPLARAAP